MHRFGIFGRRWSGVAGALGGVSAVATCVGASWLQPQQPACDGASSSADNEGAAGNSTMHHRQHIKLFAGNGNPKLAKEIAVQLDLPLSGFTVSRFADGEVKIQVTDNVRGEDVYIIQPTCAPVNDNLMELLLTVSTMRRSSAKRITCIIPYYGYKRSTGAPVYTTTRNPGTADETVQAGVVPIAGSDVAHMLQVMGADRVVAVDLQPPGHGQIEGFFDTVTVENIESTVAGVEYFRDRLPKNLVVVAPNEQSMKKARDFQHGLLGSGYRWNDKKERLMYTRVGVALIVNKPMLDHESSGSGSTGISGMSLDLVGSVDGADVLVVDDLIDSGRTLISRVELLKKMGAKKVYCFATHGVFSGEALDRVQASDIEEVIVTNTIPIPEEHLTSHSKIKQVSVAPMIAEVIRRLVNKESTETFRVFNKNDMEERYGGQGN